MFKVFVLTTLYIGSALSQQGPTVECSNCEGSINKPYPVGGNWYNPDQSGSGYIMEIQNGFLSGFYFGYDSEGSPTQLNFQGPLEQPEQESDVLWQLNTNFISFKNGNALNQPHQSPEAELTEDAVLIEFISKHNARISINGEPHQNILPLVYGVAKRQEFDEIEKQFPDLEGLWTFVYKRNYPNIIVQESLYFNEIYGLRKAPTVLVDGTTVVSYSISKYYAFGPFEIIGVGNLVCSNPIDETSNQRKVICELRGFPNEGLGFDYVDYSMIVPIGDFGAFNFTAELTAPDLPETGFSIEATRVNFINDENRPGPQ